jgi:hypothetical protein
MIGAAQRYRELLFDLVVQRELAGGALAATEEARLIAKLDHCWNVMTDDEQGELERSLDEPARTATQK